MTLQQLEYFLAAVAHRSFSAAAQALHMAQPSLSEQIRRLEAELGSPLFIRGRRGLELTEAGRLFQPHAERTLAAAQEAGDSVREVRELAAGTATFGTFGNAPYYLLSDLVQDFRARYPNVRVRLLGQNSSEVADAVRDGHIEAGPDRAADRRPRPRHRARDRRRAAVPLRGPRPRARADDDRAARRGAADPLRRALRLVGPDAAPARRAGPARGRDDRAGDRGRVRRGGARPRRRAASATRSGRAGSRSAAGSRGACTTSSSTRRWSTRFAFITRRNAHLSPATRAFMELAAKRLEALGRRTPAAD